MVLLANSFPSLLLLAGVLILVAVLMRRTYRRAGRRVRGRKDRPLARLPRPTGPWSAAQADAVAQLGRREVELHELYRQLSAQLDSKIILLQQLMRQGEEMTQRLERIEIRLAEQQNTRGASPQLAKERSQVQT